MRVIESKAIECYYDKHGLMIPFKKEYKIIKRIDKALLWLYTLTDDEYQDDSGAPRAREAHAWAEPDGLSNLPIPENLVIT